MPELKELHVKNFQSHKHTVLKFVDGVNAIIGKSQSGKTAIIRALELLRTLRPSGIRYKRWDSSDPVVVKAVFNPDTTISLMKNKSSGKYKLDGETFEKFGTHVPPEISDAVNISDLNVQTQLSTPFLITDSSYQVSHTINNIIKTEKIDEWISKLNKKISEMNNNISIRKSDVESLTREITKYKGHKQIDLELRKAKTANQKIVIAANKADLIETKTQKYKRLKRQKEEIEKILEADEHLNNAGQLFETIRGKERVLSLLEKYKQFQIKKGGMERINGELKKLYEKALENKDRIEKLETLDYWLSKFKRNAEKKAELQQATKEYQNAYMDLIKSLDNCPFCFSSINDKQKKIIRGKL